jgi:putative acetyltransferase
LVWTWSCFCITGISETGHWKIIGKSLVNRGLSLLKAQGAKGCALVGDPGYYQRFGFKNNPTLIHDGIPQEVFLVIPFDKNIPHGTVVFHEGFLANG